MHTIVHEGDTYFCVLHYASESFRMRLVRLLSIPIADGRAADSALTLCHSGYRTCKNFMQIMANWQNIFLAMENSRHSRIAVLSSCQLDTLPIAVLLNNLN